MKKNNKSIRREIVLAVLLCLFIAFNVAGQTTINLAESLQDGNERNMINSLRLSSAEVNSVSDGGFMNIKGLRLSSNRTVNLSVTRFRSWDERTQFVVADDAGERPMSEPTVVLFRGVIEDEKDSDVFLAVDEQGGVRGWIRTSSQTYSIFPSEDKEKVEQKLMYIEKSPRDPNYCDADASGLDRRDFRWDPLKLQFQVSLTTTLRADIAFDCDWEYRQNFSSLLEAQNYAVTLLGAVSGIYERDINTRLVATYVRIWDTSTDPYSATNACDALVEIRKYWEKNMKSIKRHTAHLLSGKYGGGCAYVKSLNSKKSSYGANLDITGIISLPLKNRNPGNWEPKVFAHELGHNFSTSHTHCYEPPIDKCYNGQSGCYGGPVVPTQGTIMSYCHTNSGGILNINMNFHPAVQTVMRSYAGKRLPDVLPDLFLTDEIITTTETFLATNSITTGPNFTIASSANVTFHVLHENSTGIILRYGFTAARGSNFRAYIGSSANIVSLVAANSNEKENDNSDSQINDDKSKLSKNNLQDTMQIPTEFSLAQNYPNPFNPTTTLNYALKEDAEVSLKIYNLLGQKVKTLVDSHQSAGFKSVAWDAKNELGARVPSGIYIYRVVAGDFSQAKRMVLLK